MNSSDFVDERFKVLFVEGIDLPFSSLLFLFLFFPITMFLYAYVGDISRRNKVLIVSSIIFYFWAAPAYLPILFIMTLTAWAGANMISKSKNSVRMILCSVFVFIQILALFYFKFVNQTAGFDPYIGKYFVPIGLTFYVLRLVTYLIDVYRNDAEACSNFTDVLLFSSIFHLSIAAPIVCYKEIAPTLKRRTAVVPEIGKGINRFTIGIFKVSVLALSCDQIVRVMFPEELKFFEKVPALGLWIGMIAFMIQMYLVCSAYSDMAIGMGKMIGFKYKENFDYPYMATSIHTFCNKWYISLADFIKDYIYLPIKGAKFNHIRKTAAYVLSAVFLVLFFGKNWNGIGFIVFYIIVLFVEKHVLDKKLNNLNSYVRHVYTLIIVCFGWMILRFTDVQYLFALIKGLFGLNGNGFIQSTYVQFSFKYVAIIIAAAIGCTPLLKQAYQWIQKNSKKYKILIYVRRFIEVAGPIILILLSAAALFSGDCTTLLYF